MAATTVSGHPLKFPLLRRFPAALLSAAMSLTSGPLASTLTVTNNQDSGAGSLRDAVVTAAPGDEIVFDASLAGLPIILSTGELVIEKNLTITGLGRHLTILSGPIQADPFDGLEHRILAVRSGTVAYLAGLSLVHGSTVQGGGAILNEGDLTVRDCELSDNFSASGDGGAIYNRGHLVLLDTAFLRNLIEDHGAGSGLFNATSSSVRVSRSVFSENQSPLGGGAAIANAGYIEAENCDVVGNRTFRAPGALENRPGAVFHLERSIVRDNYALISGGGAGNGGLLSIVGSTFVNNTIGLRFGSGGGIDNAGTLFLTDSTIQGNGVVDAGGHGAGIYNHPSGSVTLNNTTVTGNYLGSSEYGGAAGLENAGTAVSHGSLIAGNFALSYCYAYQPPPERALSSDLKGVVDSLGHNFVGGCTDLDPATCSESIACSGFQAQDSLDAEVEQLVESEPLQLWPWAEGSPRRGLLASNGGPTPTVALLPGSPAIDDIPPGDCADVNGDPILTDQRGTPRPQGTGCDAGSYEFSLPRGTGFWAHQCSGLGYAQLTSAEMQGLFDQVEAASSSFPECASIGCDTLRLATPQNDMRGKAERSLLGLWLNVITGRSTRGRPIDLPALTTAANIGEALAEVELMVCDADAGHGDLGLAKEIAEAINNRGEDMELVALESSATILPGATRSFTLAVVNMCPEVRSYDLAGEATWPVTLSLTRVNGLGPGQIALVTATLFASGASPGQTGEIRIIASDRGSEATLERTATIRILVGDPTGPGGGRRIRRLACHQGPRVERG